MVGDRSLAVSSGSTTLRGPMRTNIQAVILLSLSLMTMLLTTAARADDTVSIRIYNDGADNMVVTVYDMNAQPPGAILASQRINGFAWIPVSVTADEAGRRSIYL